MQYVGEGMKQKGLPNGGLHYSLVERLDHVIFEFQILFHPLCLMANPCLEP